jgi:hypothetical protein
MATNDRQRQPLASRNGGDIILFQRISCGWEYRYTSEGDTWSAFDCDPAQAKTRLKRQLGWDRQRFERADFRRF